MAVVLTYGAGVPVVKLGRIAGQFAKPRSSATEVVDGQALPSFRGHVVNDDAPTEAARTPDPTRMLAAYHQSASTLNLLRAFTKGGFADLSQVHTWNQQFVAGSPGGQHYEALAAEIDRALRFMRACGINLGDEASLQQVDFWTSHEALILGYEEAMTRRDSLTGDWYDTSAHLVWVGERTRRLDGAHVDFLSGLSNPVGGQDRARPPPPKRSSACAGPRPGSHPGRLTLITRLGAGRVAAALPPLLDAVRQPAIRWCGRATRCTATRSPAGGRKTRHFDHVISEIREFFAVCRREGAGPEGCTSSSPAKTSPSASVGAKRSSRTTWSCATPLPVTPASTAASRSTWPFRSPTSCVADLMAVPGAGPGRAPDHRVADSCTRRQDTWSGP